MSNQTSQKYYLINLSTRNVSISTHLRAENFTLGSGKCIYLGHLTDEQIVKYHRYSALNVSLRILTADKAKQILNKSINATESLKESILENKILRVEHEAGSISDTSFNVSEYNKLKMFSNPKIQQRLKQEKDNKIKSKKLSEEKLEIQTENNEIIKNDLINENIIKVNDTKKIEVIEEKEPVEENVEIKSEETKVQESTSTIENVEDIDEDKEQKQFNDETVDESLLPKQIDVVEENAKLELEKMSYSDLYDLAKANNITFKKKPNRQTLIDTIAAAQL